ncbi:MAG TPA: amino acid adenylation domain-containing protein, partial [Solirubrobacteraceae bacterium]|nr:amino acid adenylation domain-containing protein [Solirubrobacteraceae bacterium]
PQERDAEVDRLLGALAIEPFDLSSDVLLRAALVHLAPDEDLLLIVLHHIGSDHVSSAILFKELDELYGALSSGSAPQLAELPIQYADFARWQREQLNGSQLTELLEYWSERLAGAPERLDVPSDRPRPSVQSYRGKLREFTIGRELAQPLRELARRNGVSTFTVLLAVFKTLMHRYSGAEDLVVGVPASGRHHEETASLLGFFSNTLAMRTDLSGDPPFEELLQRVKTTTLEAQIHQELPFERLVEALNPQRSQSHSPIFQVLFGYDVAPVQPPTLAGSELEQLPIPGWQWSRFDLSIIARELPDGSLRAQLEYATDLFDAATIERTIGHFTTLLSAVCRDPAQRLSRLALLTDEERHTMLVDWNATRRPYDRRCLHELIAEQAARSPDALAVVSEHDRLTYGQLDARSNQLAHELIEAGVERGSLVGMCLERSVDLLVSMLAVLKAGAAYVPIDPTYPPQRQEFMLADAEAPVLITQSRFLGAVDPRGARVVCVDRDRAQIETRPTEPVGIEVDPEQRAYVIYTSGSTGRPKGVEVTHRSVANLIVHMRERPGLSERDVVANLTTPAFDLSVPDWYLPLTTGARLVIVPREATLDGVELADWLARSGATFVQATPTTWQVLIDASWTGSAALKIVCGGEALPRALAEELQSRCASLWHMYGPTETTVWSSIMELEPGEGPIPLGGPIANTRFYVLDANRQPVPIGIPGELLIGGDGLALGYRNRPELTAEKFVGDPFSMGARAHLYRTGDLVRRRESGTLEFLGRIDQQVKLRGFRIELGEIEAVLDSHHDVSGAVAVVREDSPGDQRLVAYVVSAVERTVDSEQLRRLCKTRLPPFMVPSAFVSLDAFPVTANGKLDRSALPAPDGSRPDLERTYAAPETPVEQSLASIWSEILGVERIGLDDDFFDLGGHSLLAVKMLSRVQESFDLNLLLHNVFEHSTVRELAAVITAELFGATDEDELSALLAEVEASE